MRLSGKTASSRMRRGGFLMKTKAEVEEKVRFLAVQQSQATSSVVSILRPSLSFHQNLLKIRKKI